MSNEEINRKIAVIFATDLVGYSKHMEKDENATLRGLRECNKIIEPLIKKQKGRIFNTGGDSVFAEFPSAVAAVDAAVEFQKQIKTRNDKDTTDVKLEYRIGINMGDVVKEGANLLGDGVNIAARLEALAQPGGITISKNVYDLVSNKTKYKFNDLGMQKVKQNQFHAFDLLMNPLQKRSINTKSKIKINILSSIAAVAILLAGLITYQFYLKSKDIRDPKLDDKRVLLVLPFQNLANSSKHDFIAESMFDFFVGGLSSNLGSRMSLDFK